MSPRKLPNTSAYLKLRKQIQSTFDFAVVVCHGVPSLKRQISLLEKGEIKSLPRPDYFPEGKNPPEQLRKQARGYKQKLSSFTLLSTFSFFESFVIDAISEMIDYHGGNDELIRKAENRDKKFMVTNNSSIENHKQRLRGKKKKGHKERYKKHSQALDSEGYRFPSERFSSYGVRMLIDKLENLRSVEIPELLREGLLMDISDSTTEQFHNIRDLRNKIAHGKPVSLSLSQISEINKTLRDLAFKIDEHLNHHFILSESYV